MSNPAGAKNQAVYFQNLDALRFLAAFSVFIFHYFRDIQGFFPFLQDNRVFRLISMVTDKGGLGVNFFFVLSGFLITYLILKEKADTGSFSLWRFFVRRTLRIWPLYFIIVLLGFVLFPLIYPNYYTVHNPLNYLFFLANFDEIRNGLNDPVNFLTAPWSVAVEEQFYLFWSLLLFPLLKLKKFTPEMIILILYGISFYFRWINLGQERIIYYHTLSVCQDILTGCFIGVSLFRQQKWIHYLISLTRWKIVLIYILGFLVCIGKNKLFTGDFHVAERFVLSLFFGFVILDQSLGQHSFIKAGKWPWLNFLGKISYGFYMYHLVIMYVLTDWFAEKFDSATYLIPVYFLASLALTILISWLSFILIEQPLLRLKPVHKS